MNKSDSIVELSKALAKFQEEVKQPLKDADNPFFRSKYVPLENVVEAITECAPKQGLAFLQWPCNSEDGRIGIVTMITHSSGEYIEFDPVYMKSEKDTPQGNGSTLTYLRRYSLSAVFGITSDQDDDANEGSGNNNKQQKQSDPLTEKLTVTFSQAMQKLGSANNVYKALNTNQTNMKKLFNSNNKKQKEETLKQLEGLIA
jgi:hypothetical protein